MKPEQKTSEQFDRFTNLVDQVLTVPKAELDKRQEEYLRAQKTKRNGGKAKP